MACCVFAAFLIAQIYAGYEAVLAFFGRARTTAPSAAVTWRLGDPAPANAIPQRRAGRAMMIIGAAAIAELVLLAGAANWLVRQNGIERIRYEVGALAQVRSFAEFRDLCGI